MNMMDELKEFSIKLRGYYTMKWDEAATRIQMALANENTIPWMERKDATLGDGLYVTALLTAVDALNLLSRFNWISTAECRPEAHDASHTGYVLAVKQTDSGTYVTTVKWSYCTPGAYPYWKPFPPAP